MKYRGRRRSALLVGVAVSVGGLLIAGAPADATQLLTETFTGAATSSSSWVDVGTNFTPCLTAGTDTAATPIPGCGFAPPENSGSGVLRLTRNGGDEAGAVLYNQAQPTSGGLQVDFVQAQWGGYSADGIAFFLADGSGNLTSPGAAGGALGYSATGSAPGVAGGLFGVGFDSWGNFISPSFSGSGCGTAAGNSPSSPPANQLTIRGPGNGTVGYCLVGSVNLDKSTQALHTSARGSGIPTRVVLDPSTVATPKITVSMDFGSGLTQIIQVDAPPMPPTFTFGFTAGTGGLADNHEIWNLSVQTLKAVAPKLTVALGHSGAFAYGGTGTFTATVGADPTGGPETSPVSLSGQLSNGVSVAAVPTGSGWDCSSTVLGSGTVSCTTTQTIAAGASAPSVSIPVAIAGGASSPATLTASAASADSSTANASDSVALAGAPIAPAAGYWLMAADGGVFTYGRNTFYGSLGSVRLAAPVTAGVPTADDGGYLLVGSDGGVFAFGDARYLGSLAGRSLSSPVVGIALSRSGTGYWLVQSDGTVTAFGTARALSSGPIPMLRRPIVGIASSASGDGYWLVASDGGVFASGDAGFAGSAGGLALNKPIVGIARTATGHGYWLVASDGGVFSYGDAAFHGSTGGRVLNKPIVSIVRSPGGFGYWLVASDGGVFSLGDAPFAGSAASIALRAPMVAAAG